MKKVIEKIKSKPAHQQNKIVFGIILSITLLLLIAWALIGVPARINDTQNKDLLEQFNSDYNESKNLVPNLSPKN